MSVCARRTLAAAAGACALFLAACQGNLGTGGGGGIGLPQTPGYGQGQAQPGVPPAASRQRVLEGAVTRSADLDAIPLPSLEGFSVALALGTPTPPPSPTASPAGAGASAARTPGGGHGARVKSAAVPSPSATPSPRPSVSAAGPSPDASASASPSPANSDESRANKIATKTTIYPDDAPSPPTPQPSGNVQTFLKRAPLVRGYVSAGEDVALYGLGALRFTIPASEATAQRGFTVAIFEAGKKHHDKLVAYDAHAALADGVVASSLSNDPLTLKKDTGYLLMLYGDELPATPAPAVSGYPPPGNNPFVTPIPSGYPGGPGGPPAGAASPPPYGAGTVPPNVGPSHF